jgi:hypothetical protein
MNLKELEARVSELEKTVADLKSHLSNGKKDQQYWWQEIAGSFANDPVFDEVVRLGKQYRDSQVPDYMKKKKKPARKKTATK